MPRFEIEKVPPWYSSGDSLPSRARLAKSFIEAEISFRPFEPASRMTGVISPPSIATATEMSTWS